MSVRRSPRAAARRLQPPPRSVYRRLLAAYGPQGWWPVTVGRGRAARPVYRPGFRGVLTEAQREEVCAGAILTQNTAWTNVERALAALRAAGVRRLSDLEALPPRRLEALIRSSGCFRQKARKLRAFAAHARERGPLSRWLAGPLPELREELLGLWGIGPETADSMLLYAGGRPSFVIDAYTLRLGRRLRWFSQRDGYHEAQRALAAALPRDAAVCNELHALIVAHAKRHCRAAPACEGCPLLVRCAYGRRALSLPRRLRSSVLAVSRRADRRLR